MEDVPGSIVREAVERSLAGMRDCYSDDDYVINNCEGDNIAEYPWGGFMQFSRLQIEWGYCGSDPTVHSLKVQDGGSWTDLDDASYFRVSTTDYIYYGR